ncbi:MAG: HisA/HisF-related TIM barrel protein [Flavobacteriales bacterium]|nr:HisA/HisF-related TIM barrel protein [Flavobacteriales bacterium]MDW8431411.1 HisA/HisF-related TIM barrel protein [Flavobacteriales bacterium]
MALQRVIPVLLLSGNRLVKTRRFKNPVYIGDPLNTLRIFNRLQADEVCFLDIEAARKRSKPNISLIRRISAQAFMPLSYGGGISDADTGLEIVSCGVEKLVMSTAVFEQPALVERLVARIGSQSVVCALDVCRTWTGKFRVVTRGGQKALRMSPQEALEHAQQLGVGEILLTDVSREGTWEGLNIELAKTLIPALRVPLIMHGGARDTPDVQKALDLAGVSAVAIGNMAVFQKPGGGILINYPSVKRRLIGQN